MPTQLPGVPPEVTVAIDQLKEELARAAGPNLSALVLYGGLARGRFRPGKSDVNIVLVLHEASTIALDAVTSILQGAWRTTGVVPMILARGEIATTIELFPIKFLDIIRHHIVLAGDDPFVGSEPPRRLIALHLRQGLRNMLMRLRRSYVAANGDSGMMSRVLAESARSFAIEMSTMLWLAGAKTPMDDRSAALFDAAADAFGFEQQSLARWAALRHDSPAPNDVPALYAKVVGVVAKAAEIADRSKEAVP